jgi:aldehyde:ferredoxin oxidoreductase
MTERFGFWNRILHVDLGERSWRIEEPGDDFFRLYGGGRGLIAHYLLEHVPANADPLGPDNILVFAPGVITGAPVPGAGRHSVGALSPLTGGFGESEAGGFWGAELKRARWDGLVIHGVADSDTYLYVTEDDVEFHDASEYRGQITGPVQDAIREKHDDQLIRVAQIGPAGENMVRFAALMNDLNEAAGRTGMGAVMGSKRLRAVAVRGKNAVRIADPDAIKRTAKWVASTLMENHQGFHEFGTGGAMQGKSLQGGMPTMNYREGSFEDTGMVDAVAIRDKVRIGMESCFACSVRCKKVVQIEQREEDAGTTKRGQQIAWDEQGRYRVDPRYGGPEYESLASFGPNIGVNDLVAVCKSNELCNSLGMDTISAGATIAWAMEWYEKEVLTNEDTGGVPIRFSDAEGVIGMLERIARREGVGDLLAEGSKRAAETIGRGSEEFLTTVKGMEMGMHDPRHLERMRVSYLLAPTGGDHMSQTSNKNGLRNQVGLCHFLGYDEDQSLEIMRAVTGWDLDADDLVTMAHRGLTLARLVNMREGFTREDDALPPRFAEALPLHEGLTDEQQGELVTDYYRELGWDERSGEPTEATIERLGLAADAARV